MGKKWRSLVETNSPIGAEEKEAKLQLFARFNTFSPLSCYLTFLLYACLTHCCAILFSLLIKRKFLCCAEK
ncbi:H(+)/Cl(-) exchange transporter [Trichinella pseudospiralis]